MSGLTTNPSLAASILSSVCSEHKNAGQGRWQDFNCRNHYDSATSMAAALTLLKYYDSEYPAGAAFSPLCPVCSKPLSVVCGRAAGAVDVMKHIRGYATTCTWAEWYRLMYQHIQLHITRGVSSNHMEECRLAVEYIQTAATEAYMSGVFDTAQRD